MREIGSEFWTEDLSNDDNGLDFLNIGKDFKLLMSGRTAIDYILSDIEDNIKIVYMPDYCCESMVQPFLDNGYKVVYYHADVINKKYYVDLNIECSIFFAMNYFGYEELSMDEYIEKFSRKDILTIEDITHRLLSNRNYCKYSDYLICSLRKWFPLVSGGVAISLKKKFKKDILNYTVNEKIVDIRLKAMNLKRDYMNNKASNKDLFFKLYTMSNKLIEDYRNKKIDAISLNILRHLDIEKIKKIRVENCLKIESLINEKKGINLLCNYSKGDCPLFVPILLANRDKIRNALIKENVYLPIHWPNFNDFTNDIYRYELSLICDQRYSEEDCIKYINKLINVLDEVE